MQSTSKSRIMELQIIISKMPLDVCCGTVLPEFGVRWREVFRAVRNARLPLAPTSVAQVLCRHVAKSMAKEEIAEIVSRLRLKLMAAKQRTWHVIKLSEQINDEPINILPRVLPSRVLQALRGAKCGRDMRPEIQTVKLGDLLYISVQMVSDVKEGGVLYVATPPGEPVALVSSLHNPLVRACVQGLGFQKFEDASLNGHDIYSLLRIYNTNHTENAGFLARLPEYSITPCLTRSGIDFTGRKTDEQYANEVLGPDPPHLEKLTVTVQKELFDPQRLNKKMKITILLKSKNVAQMLQCWSMKGVISPTSVLITKFNKMKSNKIDVDGDK